MLHVCMCLYIYMYKCIYNTNTYACITYACTSTSACTRAYLF